MRGRPSREAENSGPPARVGRVGSVNGHFWAPHIHAKASGRPLRPGLEQAIPGALLE
jgi:hypothetical protein